MLQKQVLPIPMTSGLDDKVSKIVKGAQFLEELENVDLTKKGEVTKRKGSYQLASGLVSLKAIYPFNDSIVYNQNNQNLNKINPDETDDFVGEIQADFYGEESFRIQNPNINGLRSATIGGNKFVTLIGQTDNAIEIKAYYYLFSTSNNQFTIYGKTHGVVEDADIHGSNVIADDTNFFVAVIYDHPSQTPHFLDIFKYSSSGALISSNTLASQVGASRGYPIELVQDDTHIFCITKQSNSNDDVVKITKINKSTLAEEGTQTIADPEAKSRNVLCLDAYLHGGQIYIFTGRQYINSSNQFCVSATKINVALSSQSSQVIKSINAGANSYNITVTKTALVDLLIVCWDSCLGTENDDICIDFASYDLSSDTTVVCSSDTNKQLAGPFFVAGDVISYSKDGSSDITNILPVRYKETEVSPTISTLLFFDIELSVLAGGGNATVIAKYSEDLLGEAATATNHVEYNSRFTFSQAGITYINRIYPTNTANDRYRQSVVYLEFQSMTPRSVVFKDLLFLTGNYLHMYDGAFLTENNFLYEPKLHGVTTYFTNGGQFSNGLVQVKVIYRYITTTGVIVDSRPSVPYTLNFTGGGSTQRADLGLVQQYRGGFRTNEEQYDTDLVSIIVFRTELDGSIYYRTSETVDNFTGASSILANETLYTQSGVDGNASVGACKYITVFDDRLMILGGENADKVLYSKNNEINFYDLLVGKDVPKGVYKPNGLIALDSRLLIFKRNKVFQLFGSGADRTGSGDYEPVRQLPFEQGLKDDNSLVLSTIGVLYKSLEGIYLINRGLQNSYIGARVEGNNSLTINSATSADSSNEILFFTDTKTLVYNYENNIWSTNTGQSTVWSTNHDDKLYYCTASEVLYRDESYTENATSYSMRFKTSWTKLSSLTGFSRVWRGTLQGVYIGDHTVEIKIYYDYSTTASETLNYTVTSGDMEIEFLPAQQRCKSIQFEITFVGDNQNCSLNAIDLLLGLKGNKHRITKDKRAV